MDINGIQKVAVAATPWLAVAVAGLLVLWLVLRRSVTTLFEEAPVWKLQRVTLAMLGFVAVVAISETVKAKFRVSPKINSARLSAETVDAGSPLDGLGAQTVTFANGLSGWTEFQMNAIIPCTVRKADHRWAWKVSQIDGAAVTEFDCATTGPHRVYVVLDRPVEPAWRMTAGSPKNPWTNALDFACNVANGQSTAHSALSAITSHLFNNAD